MDAVHRWVYLSYPLFNLLSIYGALLTPEVLFPLSCYVYASLQFDRLLDYTHPIPQRNWHSSTF
ncbi:hypothetical protein BYT27DRAFT_6858361 [Phlegmacium glaucopus]|nr:hypothetical protein BYT27DRAFT_6858361 [Phlegmacium glaucopus]